MSFRRIAVLVSFTGAVLAGPLMATPAFAAGTTRPVASMARTVSRAVPQMNCRAIRWLPKSLTIGCR